MSDEPPAGVPVDVIWIDETIKRPEFYSEYYARLLDRQGFIFWSSFPGRTGATCADKLDELRAKAVKCREDGTGRVSHFSLPTDENPHFSKQQIDEWAEGLSEEEYKIRVKGESQTSTLLMYPRFDAKTHAAIIEDGEEDEVSKILRARAGEPPNDWMRELFLDPGTNKPAVLLCAVPPPQFGHYYIPYREIYIPGLDAAGLAPEVVKAIGGFEIERMIIDYHAGRVKPMGFGLTIQKNYENEWGMRGISSRSRGCRFIPGSDDVPGRISEVISGLRPAPGHKYPSIRIVVDNCPNLVSQMRRYKKEIRGGGINDWRPAKYQDIDLAVCLEYGFSRKPFYVQPSGSAMMSPQDKMFIAIRKMFGRKKKQQEDRSCHIGGEP
jgi:hypothetical protein